MSLKYTLERFRWVKALWSPFKPFKVGCYVGKTQVGVPYFYPRKFVKYTDEDTKRAVIKYMGDPNKVKVPMDKLYDMYKNYTKAVPLTIGFSYCGLGWKTKWSDSDYRHEWNPVFSFVFFGYQIAFTFYSPHGCHYWEPWLFYEYSTDKTKSKRERIEQCRKEAPETWTSSSEGTIDYYERILKSKYLK